MIELQGVSLQYPDGTLALQNVNLEFAAGELVYIIGASGSGKTSLLKLLMGEEYPTNGIVRVLGQAIKREEASNIRKLRRNIGPVFQEFRLIKGRSALENVMLGMRFLDYKPRAIKEMAIDMLNKVGLGHKTNTPVENMSWGECQRVAIARAVVRKPQIILADEPTGNLDKENALKIIELLSSFKDEKTSVIITTHATHLIEEDFDGILIKVNGGNIRHERVGSV